jgi:5-methylcytosine-specific restriction endonuclease McrA
MIREEVDPVSDVLVLNSDMQPLHRVSLRHAVRMLVREVAELHDYEPDRIIGVWPMPTVVRLVRYVVTKWRLGRGPAWSRRGVLARDGHRCGYCGKAGRTVDHIVPRCQGGQNTWANTVAACDRCNQRKADRTPKQAGMVLHITPYAPTWAAGV